MNVRLLAFLVAICISVLPSSLLALPNNEVPPELKPWIEWVEGRHPEWSCPKVSGVYSCVWPGLFTAVMKEDGGTFTLKATLFRSSKIHLPSSSHLPALDVQITVDGASSDAVVIKREGDRDYVEAPPGAVMVTGKWRWSTLPQQVPLPPEYGLVDIKTDAKLTGVEYHRVGGELRLEKKESSSSKVPDSLEWAVTRRIEDGAPLTIETLLKVKVSGKARPVEFGTILPDRVVPVAINSPLPAHLDKDGRLAVQVAPGTYTISITALSALPRQTLVLPERQGANWPEREIIAWLPKPDFRTVEISGGASFVAELAELPQEWKQGTILSFKPGASISFNELRRGEYEAERNQLALRREIWVPEAGRSLTIRDTLTGALHQDRRINASQTLDVGRLTLNNNPWLITLDSVSGLAGAEVRQESLSLEALSVSRSLGDMSIAGWLTTMQSVDILFHTPPSWKFFSVSGIPGDVSTGSWVDSWTLLSLFWILLIVVATDRLLNRKTAVVVFLCYVLGHLEFIFPSHLYVYVLLFLLWCKLLPHATGVWMYVARFCLGATFVVWSVQALSYAKLQFTQALFPQLEAGTRYRTLIQELFIAMEGMPLFWGWCVLFLALLGVALPKVFAPVGWLRRCGRVLLLGTACFASIILLIALGGLNSRWASNSEVAHYPSSTSVDEFAINSYQAESIGAAPQSAERHRSSGVKRMSKALFSKDFRDDKREPDFGNLFGGKNPQAGPAVPTWRWRSYYFTIPGPLDPAQEISFVLLSPFVVRLLCITRFLLILGLITLTARACAGAFNLQNRFERGSRKLSQALALLLLTFISPTESVAEFPSSQLLKELEGRLQSEQCLDPECAYINEVRIKPAESTLSVSMGVSSKGRGAVQLPGPVRLHVPLEVTIAGKPTHTLRVNSQNYLEVAVPQGETTLEAKYPLGSEDVITLQFVTQPRAVRVDGDDWVVEGVTPSGEGRTSLRFIRKGRDGGTTEPLKVKQDEVSLPGWTMVTRRLEIGEKIDVITSVRRLGQRLQAETVEFPALPSEQITSSEARKLEEKVKVSFREGQRDVTFPSRLALTGTDIQLVATSEPQLTERWEVTCGAFISCERSGLVPTSSTLNGMKIWSWYPFPGETVTITRTPLKAKVGDPVTVDSVVHDITSTPRSYEGNVQLSARATALASFEVRLPKEFSVNSFSFNGVRGSGTKSEDTLKWVLTPGIHTITLSYSSARETGLAEYPPALSLSASSYNIRTTWSPDSTRWLVWTGGGLWGPSVVFWAKWFVILILCVMLARLGLIPLSSVGAAIFSWGLAMLPVVALVFPLLWLGLLVFRRELIARVVVFPRWIVVSGFSFLTLVSLIAFYSIVQTILVGTPPMLVAGNSSSLSRLVWFGDVSGEWLPQPVLVTLPLWLWRSLSLGWSVWLVIRLVGWFPFLLELFQDQQTVETAEAV